MFLRGVVKRSFETDLSVTLTHRQSRAGLDVSHVRSKTSGMKNTIQIFSPVSKDDTINRKFKMILRKRPSLGLSHFLLFVSLTLLVFEQTDIRSDNDPRQPLEVY